VTLNIRVMVNDEGVRRHGIFEGSVKALSGKGGTACRVNGSRVRYSNQGTPEQEAGSLFTQPRRTGEGCIRGDKTAGADCHT
jgi:hypothetical protein